ncbi:unnamed protein product [Danaus chrysippus]|uniref:(African queen) hypothetical protein n=1 Tax=Danaus chrysippus TaxID=151541 RepID=A0A8J2R544_9NEOP|nr:unnamed protein product [Danaus chrysippus]
MGANHLSIAEHNTSGVYNDSEETTALYTTKSIINIYACNTRGRGEGGCGRNHAGVSREDSAGSEEEEEGGRGWEDEERRALERGAGGGGPAKLPRRRPRAPHLLLFLT